MRVGSMSIEVGLSSFIWPISEEIFLDSVFKSRVLAIQGCGSRLDSIKSDLSNFNVKQLLEEATKIVVWMPNKGTKEMQYIDSSSSPDIALSCYHAGRIDYTYIYIYTIYYFVLICIMKGHSLYFNPSIEVQRKYIKVLASDLKMDFGAFSEGGKGNYIVMDGRRINIYI